MPRLFYALMPDPGTRDRLYALGNKLAQGRFVARENLHITLVFLGQVDEETRQELLLRTAAINGQAFEIVLSRCGWWKRAGVLWIAPDSVPQQLTALVSGLSGIARGCNIRQDSPPYQPHVTLARKMTSPVEMIFEPVSWQVRDFCLVESKTLAAGAEYSIIRAWPLT